MKGSLVEELCQETLVVDLVCEGLSVSLLAGSGLQLAETAESST